MIERAETNHRVDDTPWRHIRHLGNGSSSMNTRKAIIASAAAGIVLAGGLSLAAPDWQPVQPATCAFGPIRQ